MIFESLASKRPQEAALFLRPYLVSVLGLPVAKPHLFFTFLKFLMVALNSYRLCAFCGVPECD